MINPEGAFPDCCKCQNLNKMLICGGCFTSYYDYFNGMKPTLFKPKEENTVFKIYYKPVGERTKTSELLSDLLVHIIHPPTNLPPVVDKKMVDQTVDAIHDIYNSNDEYLHDGENAKQGLFFNLYSDKPHERHCRIIDCAHLEKPYRTCDIVPNIQRLKPCGSWGTCFSFEPRKKRTKEEPKMSDVKSNVQITYKPVDKKAQVSDILASVIRHVRVSGPNDFGIFSVKTQADKIDFIYNGKEEDGEILDLSVRTGKGDLSARPNDGKIQIAVYDYQYPGAECVFLTKQQTKDLAQALLKMCEQ